MKKNKTQITAEAMANKLFALREEENRLENQLSFFMQNNDLDEVRTDKGLITAVETRAVNVVSEVKLEVNLVERFNMDPKEIRSAIADSYKCEIEDAHLCVELKKVCEGKGG